MTKIKSHDWLYLFVIIPNTSISGYPNGSVWFLVFDSELNVLMGEPPYQAIVYIC